MDKATTRLTVLASRILCFSIAICLICSLLGCASEEDRSRGFRDGYRAGQLDGQREGHRVARQEALEKAEPAAYDRQLQLLMAEGRFRYHRGFLGATLVSGLLIGFTIQYILFLFLRRQLVLIDIDQILLGRSLAADLRHRSPEEIIESTARRLNDAFAPAEKRQLT